MHMKAAGCHGEAFDRADQANANACDCITPFASAQGVPHWQQLQSSTDDENAMKPSASGQPIQRHGQRRTRRRPQVSVCIVNWNCRHLLRACLRSLRQSVQKVRVEVIVVDNASTDGAAAMVARLFPHVILIRNAENAGFARANNLAAQRARGHYLFFLNNDTLVPPGALRRLLDYARNHPEAGLIGPRLRDGQGRVQISCRRRPTVTALLHRTCMFRWTGIFRKAYHSYREREGDLQTTRSVDVLMGAALLMRRKVFTELGPWDEGYTFGGEDIDLCTRVGRKYAVVYHPDVEITHFGRSSSRKHIGFAHTNTVIGITRFLRKNGTSNFALLIYKAVVTIDAPLLWLGEAAQYAWRRLRGQRERAAKSLLIMRAVQHFMARGLEDFWQA
jgi:GT2 family glycosyltransferase